jgi:hypothetical protein
MESKYKEGDFVFALADPTVKLVIRRYIPTIYYCRLVNDPDKELVYFERELSAVTMTVSR